jgi:hypothetical protein
MPGHASFTYVLHTWVNLKTGYLKRWISWTVNISHIFQNTSPHRKHISHLLKSLISTFTCTFDDLCPHLCHKRNFLHPRTDTRKNPKKSFEIKGGRTWTDPCHKSKTNDCKLKLPHEKKCNSKYTSHVVWLSLQR